MYWCILQSGLQHPINIQGNSARSLINYAYGQANSTNGLPNLAKELLNLTKALSNSKNGLINQAKELLHLTCGQ
jgi:hypothetical protein